jgi:hypothetical protein
LVPLPVAEFDALCYFWGKTPNAQSGIRAENRDGERREDIEVQAN